MSYVTTYISETVSYARVLTTQNCANKPRIMCLVPIHEYGPHVSVSSKFTMMFSYT